MLMLIQNFGLSPFSDKRRSYWINTNTTVKMPDHLGEDMRKTKNEEVKEEKDIKGKSLGS